MWLALAGVQGFLEMEMVYALACSSLYYLALCCQMPDYLDARVPFPSQVYSQLI